MQLKILSLHEELEFYKQKEDKLNEEATQTLMKAFELINTLKIELSK